MFKVETLPAEHGDCLWIEYGDEHSSRKILIDSGPGKTSRHLKDRLNNLSESERRFELLILSHYDDDHLGGILEYFKSGYPEIKFGDVWFNGWHHIHDVSKDLLGADQGEKFSNLVLNKKWPWNEAFGGKAVFFSESGKLPEIELDGEMKLTLLSPTPNKLAILKDKWDEEITANDKEPGYGEEEAPGDILGGGEELTVDVVQELAAEDSSLDISPSNGGSIAVLAEFGGKRALLAADAHSETLETALRKIVSNGNKLKLDLFKVSHHGSKHNISNRLMRLIDCPRFLVSTNGKKFSHPDDQAIAKLVCEESKPKELYFNYRTKFNQNWDNKELKEVFNYSPIYSLSGQTTVILK